MLSECWLEHGSGGARIGAVDSPLTKPPDVVEDCRSPDNRQLAELLHRVAAGDRLGFEMLYRLTSPRLWSVIRRIVARKQAAEDVLQNTYPVSYTHLTLPTILRV